MDDTELKYSRIIERVCTVPWATRPETLTVVMDILSQRAAGVRFTADEARARVDAARSDSPRGASRGVVAVVPLVGMIIHRPDFFAETSEGATSVQRFVSSFRAAVADSNVRSVVIDIESPGGIISGVPEAAAEVFAARQGSKKIVAVANAEAASAAYWIGSAADELVVSPSAEVGSIGVWTAHVDASKFFEEKMGLKHTLISAGKYKVEGHPFGPLDDDARAYIQERIDGDYDDFVKAVAKHRGRPPGDVREKFGQGRMVGARRAVELGMADRVGTLQETITRMQGPAGAPRKTRTAHDFSF